MRRVYRRAHTFQSSLPRGERHRTKRQRLKAFYFNPRSHEGSDTTSKYLHQFLSISILAPTRGATISTQVVILHGRDFNPRSHEGSDKVDDKGYPWGYISILAPTRGATIVKLLIEVIVKFQSSLPRGERHFPKFPIQGKNLFQSSLPRGERHQHTSCYLAWTGFQSSLPRGERRLVLSRLKNRQKISILAPTRGATRPRLLRLY